MVGAEDKHVSAVNLHPGGYVWDLVFLCLCMLQANSGSMTTLLVVEDGESWCSCLGRRSIYSHATISLTSLWGKAGHPGKVASYGCR